MCVVLNCQNETAEILQNAVDRTRRAKTILRKTIRSSHDSAGHCESAIKEVEKQIREMNFHRLVADHKCDSDRHAVWTITHYIVKAEEQTSFFKLMNKAYHSEVAKCFALRWSRSTVKQSKLAEMCKEAHRVGKLKQADGHLLTIKGSTHSARANRRKPRDEQCNLDSVKTVLSYSWK